MTEQLSPAGTAPASSVVWATWTPATKDAVGTSLGTSRLWFTVAQGIITELYYPRADIPQLKDLGFIVADGAGFWVELKRHGDYTVSWLGEVVPAITVRHQHARFTLTVRICVDPWRDVLLVDFSLAGDATLQLYVLAAPRIGGDATANQASAANWAGRDILWAEQGPFGLALAAVDRRGTPALLQRSVGCVGESDGWQDFARHGRMDWHYAAAGPGEVAMMAELPRAGTLAVGVASSRESAATLAVQSLAGGFVTAWKAYCTGWRQWLQALQWPAALTEQLTPQSLALLRRSAVVIKCHEDRTFPGALVASLSVPWGETSSSRGGYHLVWARDLVEAAGALLALGCMTDAQHILGYLIATQQADGHWFQNQWLGGKPFWQGIQLDETAFPVLLASALAEHDALGQVHVGDMVRRALAFIARVGPATDQDRWEENTGINSFTLAVAIAALVEGSRFLEERETECALMLADSWNARLEDWTWADDTALARKLGVPGYYMRTAPADVLTHDGAKHRPLRVNNRGRLEAAADEQVAIDCLQLTRFGLRAATDPKMVASVQAIDALLKTDTPSGPVWHRYNGDGYGEHPDGTPFDGWGRGRGWPLLTGERGHLALSAGEDVRPYLEAMRQMAGAGGLLPEQVWDSAAIPERGLHPGRPTGAAMPLVWTHAEFIKLAMSLAAGAPVDRPAHTWARYRGNRPRLSYRLWQPRQRLRHLPAGHELRVLLPEPGRVHWGLDGWRDAVDVVTEDWGLGHLARLSTQGVAVGEQIHFTFYWLGRAQWADEEFAVSVVGDEAQ
ncbi:MAG TPA: glycoside hydrolase family 15 protein [Steroidobacteraceae bacterium]|nr:glycoside hydrolase family 15 protein [Steroidobacteraceae bacterium]